MMTGRGGAEGYLWTGVRVLPAKGRVEARGKFGRKKRGDEKAGAVVKEERAEEVHIKKEKILDRETVEPGEEVKMEDVEMAGS